MESYLQDEFQVKAKGSSDEALQRWRNLCSVVKNPKRRFRFTANISKRYEAAAMRRSNQEKLRVAVLVSKAAFQFIQGVTPTEYNPPEEVKAAGYDICSWQVQLWSNSSRPENTAESQPLDLMAESKDEPKHHHTLVVEDPHESDTKAGEIKDGKEKRKRLDSLDIFRGLTVVI